MGEIGGYFGDFGRGGCGGVVEAGGHGVPGIVVLRFWEEVYEGISEGKRGLKEDKRG
jgi:hypothetical protein